MGLITVKATKPAAGEDKTFGNEYVLTLSDQGFLGTGDLTFFSIELTNDSDAFLRDAPVGLFNSQNVSIAADAGFGSGGIDYFQGVAVTNITDVAFQGA